MPALPGYQALVNLAAGASVASTNLNLVDAGDHKTFTVPLASTKRYIDNSVTVTVQTSIDNGVTWSSTLAATTYTLRYQTAQVVLNVALSGGSTYLARLAAFNYLPYQQIAQATDIVLQGKRTMLDATVLQGSTGQGWMSYVPSVGGGTFACKSWQLATGATIFLSHLSNNDVLIVSFVAPSGTSASEAYCFVSQSNLQAAVATLSAEDLTFQITGNIAAF